jgi:hypothetical protein
VDADLDTPLIAPYVDLEDRIVPALGRRLRRGPGRPPAVTDAQLVCRAVAQVPLGFHDERHRLRAATSRVGHLFPRLPERSQYNERLGRAAPLMEAAVRRRGEHAPGSAGPPRLMDATPIGRGRSPTTARRSHPFGWAGYGCESAHGRWSRGMRLLTTAGGTVTGLANPKPISERGRARQILAGRPAAGSSASHAGADGDQTASSSVTASAPYTCASRSRSACEVGNRHESTRAP